MFWTNSPHIFLLKLVIINLFNLELFHEKLLNGVYGFLFRWVFTWSQLIPLWKPPPPSPGASAGATKSSFLACTRTLGRTIKSLVSILVETYIICYKNIFLHQIIYISRYFLLTVNRVLIDG